MRLFEFTIRPTSGFGTTLKGDTLFGHFCWQAAYDSSLLKGGLAKWIDSYGDMPFAVFSSAWPKLQAGKAHYAMKRPDLPIHYLLPPAAGESKKAQMERRKKDMARRWMLVGEDLSIALHSAEYVTERHLAELLISRQDPAESFTWKHSGAFISNFTQPHNSISRLTMTTREAPFAPFDESCLFYRPGTNLVVFVLIDESATDVGRVRTALERIGKLGFGKDASTGRGRFEVDEATELPLPGLPLANACYTLAPSVPQKGLFPNHYFSPFIRFGKHGDRHARSKNPFKNPVIMADEGAIFVTDNPDVFQKPYIGQAVLGTSLADRNTVSQGYSIYLPLQIEIGGLT